MKKIAVLLYPDFSLQEITCLTSVLTVWFGESIDFIAKVFNTRFIFQLPTLLRFLTSHIECLLYEVLGKHFILCSTDALGI